MTDARPPLPDTTSQAKDGSGPTPSALPRWSWLLILVLLAALLAVLVLLFSLLTKPGQDARAPVRSTAQAGVMPVLSISGPGTGSRPRFSRPLAAAFDENGRIYVSDTGNDRVCIFDDRGRFLMEFGTGGGHSPAGGASGSAADSGRLDFPAGIAVAATEIFVADLRNGSVAVFDSEDGGFLRRIPLPLVDGPDASGSTSVRIEVTDVAVGMDRVFATDSARVLMMTLRGQPLGELGRVRNDRTAAAIQLDHPNGVAASADGVVYVCDSNHSRVIAFDRSGRVRWQFDSSASADFPSEPRGLQLPRGLAVASDGTVLVADSLAHRIVRLGSDGAFLGTYGSRGSDPGSFNFPNDVDERDGLVLVADKENERVQLVKLVEP